MYYRTLRDNLPYFQKSYLVDPCFTVFVLPWNCGACYACKAQKAQHGVVRLIGFLSRAHVIDPNLSLCKVCWVDHPWRKSNQLVIYNLKIRLYLFFKKLTVNVILIIYFKTVRTWFVARMIYSTNLTIWIVQIIK